MYCRSGPRYCADGDLAIDNSISERALGKVVAGTDLHDCDPDERLEH